MIERVDRLSIHKSRNLESTSAENNIFLTTRPSARPPYPPETKNRSRAPSPLIRLDARHGALPRLLRRPNSPYHSRLPRAWLSAALSTPPERLRVSTMRPARGFFQCSLGCDAHPPVFLLPLPRDKGQATLSPSLSLPQDNIHPAQAVGSNPSCR